MLMILMLVAVLPVAGQEKTKPSHWGAGGRMPARKDAPKHWGAGGRMPGKTARPDAHRRMLEKYDTNKDCKLDAAESQAMKKSR